MLLIFQFHSQNKEFVNHSSKYFKIFTISDLSQPQNPTFALHIVFPQKKKASTWNLNSSFSRKYLPHSKSFTMRNKEKSIRNWINASQKAVEQHWKRKTSNIRLSGKLISTIFMQVPFTFIHSLARIICVIGCDPLSFQFTTLWRVIFQNIFYVHRH